MKKISRGQCHRGPASSWVSGGFDYQRKFKHDKNRRQRECKSFVEKPVSIPTRGLDVIQTQQWLKGWENETTKGEN